MNGFRWLQSNFCDISSTLQKLAVKNVGIGPRNSCISVPNSNRVTQNGRILEMRENYITGKSLYCLFSRTFIRPSLETGRYNVHNPSSNVTTSRCFCTEHDGFCLNFEEFRALIESKDIQIIDVREPDEIEQEGSIPNAVNIPLGTLKKALKMDDDAYFHKYKVTKPDKYDANIVFVGLGPIKSSAARAIAYNHGYKYSCQLPGRLGCYCNSGRIAMTIALLTFCFHVVILLLPVNELSSALSLPPDKFQARYSFDISEPEDMKLVFSCRSGVRSSVALTIALELGFINSRHYGGGYSEWSERMTS